MPNIDTKRIKIEYEQFGGSSNPTLLLISGLGGQMHYWPSEFCSRIADNGFRVIRFDNRDTGFSSKIDSLNLDEARQLIGKLFAGEKAPVPYSIEDMANDAIGVLDALDIQKAHICGMSMGGFISQTLAINYPDRALSLISIYSNPGNSHEYMPTQKVMEATFNPPPEEREAYIDNRTELFQLICGTGRPFDEEFYRKMFAKSYDRCFYPDGTARQYLAVMTQKDRRDDLAVLSIPTLIIHGDEDPMIPPVAGEATAKAIPNSDLKIIKGMGHDLPSTASYGIEISDSIIEFLKTKFHGE
ncbi:MAG: alpha/beta hydrolase [Desulfobacula sp.]|jgi:pimeloyl-ACP methyl ester carboxylesterase|uniref:alpha/beta fold hydrolase n=1 Tax=Desulfobacula sp. TaxID=2593537 RepID=UPI001E02E9E8|nr:alpha/beta hydrolase [Desulfobacula sp.]MBT3487659.1 alpha/beta hydrolase [Desulfobacula sp.]MBT3806872.1 alpha/beta hydrolase [Desulfobacula sp.]MBT4026978.1 alpha/beta hydrolase [Desulfobacula sp.]MBT4199153.1 alpha/beta hydrolase [Desulfobacula sp.]